MCPDCLRKQIRIDELEKQNRKLREDNRRLRKTLGREHRTINEAPFGSSTPSSKLPHKPSSPEERRAKRGGAREGHPGHGRRDYEDLPRAPVELVAVPSACPCCGGSLGPPTQVERTVVSCAPPQPVRRDLKIEQAWCPHCQKMVRGRPADVMPRHLLDNGALAFAAVQCMLHGTTMGAVSRIMGVSEGTLHNAMHNMAELLGPAEEWLISEYRKAPVRHADETGWRNDGLNGYAWLFATGTIRLYRFRNTRAGIVAREVFGDRTLPGVLLVDRYIGYNGLPVSIQYCYAHLLRHVEDLQAEFPQDPEVVAFTSSLAAALSEAMSLRREVPRRAPYLRKAAALKARILRIVSADARHPGIQKIQSIFRENSGRLYHWVEGPEIPADNNFAERSLRPTVIARKLSFGSQSDRGMHTREILMSVIGTLATRFSDPWQALKRTLDGITAAIHAGIPPDIPALLFPAPA